MSANELTVPAHQRCRRDEEGGPTLSRKKPSECREHGAIGGGEPRPRHLAAKDRELMTEHRDLDVLLIRAWTDSDESEQLSNEQEGDRTGHDGDPGTFAASLVRAMFLRLHPTRLYGRLIDPVEGHFELGYVDLVTGDLHPAIEGGLNKNLGTGKGYLGRLAERDPARNGVRKSGAR